MTAETIAAGPYRIVDRLNQGWLTRDNGQHYEGYDPTKQPGEGILPERPLAEIERDFGPCRPVIAQPAADRDELVTAFDLAGRKTITSVASALEQVFHEARERYQNQGRAGADNHTETFAYATRTVTAGRPGSWEAAAIGEVVYFGNELNLHPRKTGLTVEAMRATGPNARRVNVPARDAIATVLRRWTDSPDHYVEVPENLAAAIGEYADERHGADGWAKIADQWLQPGGLAKENFIACYRLLYSVSAHFDPNLTA